MTMHYIHSHLPYHTIPYSHAHVVSSVLCGICSVLPVTKVKTRPGCQTVLLLLLLVNLYSTGYIMQQVCTVDNYTLNKTVGEFQ